MSAADQQTKAAEKILRWLTRELAACEEDETRRLVLKHVRSNGRTVPKGQRSEPETWTLPAGGGDTDLEQTAEEIAAETIDTAEDAKGGKQEFALCLNTHENERLSSTTIRVRLKREDVEEPEELQSDGSARDVNSNLVKLLGDVVKDMRQFNKDTREEGRELLAVVQELAIGLMKTVEGQIVDKLDYAEGLGQVLGRQAAAESGDVAVDRLTNLTAATIGGMIIKSNPKLVDALKDPAMVQAMLSDPAGLQQLVQQAQVSNILPAATAAADTKPNGKTDTIDVGGDK